ncbi:MAG: type II toxin-antitoxin system VapC family toxin [Planctomycetes bacterium]|nr:type II toxin-antitoxin system VapC family toxin [Planctomycetota bacterium]
MRDYLLDTNIWGYLFNSKKYPQEHATILKRLNNLTSDNKLSISIISWGEISVGLPRDIPRNHLKFITAVNPLRIGLDTHVAEKYGELRGLLVKANKFPKRIKGLNHEQLVDRFTWLEVGSLENDLWIAAQAITLNLTLVTNDKMEHIKKIAGESLHIDNWANK